MLVAVCWMSAWLAAPPDAGIEARLQAADQALLAGQLSQAAELLHSARAAAPGDPRPLLGLSLVAERSDEPVEALRWAREAGRVAPGSIDPALREARVLTRLGAADEAIEAFGRARGLGADQAETWIVPALLLRDQGRTAQAIALLEEAARHLPGDATVSAELGWLLLAEGRATEAERVARQGALLHADDPEIELLLGLAVASDPDRAGEAVTHVAAALRHGVDDPGRAHRELGGLLLGLGRADEARDHLERAVRALPGDPEAHYRLGSALRSLGDAEGARAELETSQRLSRERDAREWEVKQVKTALNEAQRLALDDRLYECLDRLEALLARHPDEPAALGLQAKVLSSLGRDGDALAAASHARRLAPQQEEYHYLEGLFLVRLGEPEQGAVALERALALAPDQVEAHRLLGIVLVNLDRPVEALPHLERAVALGERDPELLRALEASRESSATDAAVPR